MQHQMFLHCSPVLKESTIQLRNNSESLGLGKCQLGAIAKTTYQKRRLP